MNLEQQIDLRVMDIDELMQLRTDITKEINRRTKEAKDVFFKIKRLKRNGQL